MAPLAFHINRIVYCVSNVVYAELGCGMFNINKVEFIRLTLSFLSRQ